MRNLLISFIAIILFCVALTSGLSIVMVGISEVFNPSGNMVVFFWLIAIFAVSAFTFGKINSKKVYI